MEQGDLGKARFHAPRYAAHLLYSGRDECNSLKVASQDPLTPAQALKHPCLRYWAVDGGVADREVCPPCLTPPDPPPSCCVTLSGLSICGSRTLLALL